MSSPVPTTPALTASVTMAELIAGWPGAVAVLVRHGMACIGCAMAPFETLGEAALAYGLEPRALMQELTEATRARRQSHRRS